MGILKHLTFLLRNLYGGKEATVKTKHGTADWFTIGKGVCQGYILSPCLFNLYVVYIMWNARLDEAQAGIKIAGRTIDNLRYADYMTLMAESKELKSLLMKVKEESGKSQFKAQHSENSDHGIWSNHFIAKKQWLTLLSWAPKSLQMVTTVMKLKDTCSLEGKLWPT